MTWRTSSYLLTVILALTIVAGTALSDTHSHATKAAAAAVATTALVPMEPIRNHGVRVAFLLLGTGLVLATYRRAFKNFRDQN